MITLTSAGDTITLPGDLDWIDEYDWAPTEQDRQYSLTGALLLQEAPARQAGRPITLAGDWAWVERGTVDALRAWLTPGRVMTLTLEDTRVFTVRWRLSDGAPLVARPVLVRLPAEPTDDYRITLRLMESTA